MYIKVINGTIEKYPYSLKQLRADNPNTSFPKNPSAESLENFNAYEVIQEKMPEHNPVSQNIELSESPVLENGQWILKWVVTDKTAGDLVAEKQAKQAQLTAFAKQYLSTAMSAYSEWEAVIWPALIAEAEQFQIDGTVGEYMTAEIGGKYKTAADLAKVLLTRKEVMKQLRAGVVLVRQTKEAQIEAAKTFEDLAAVEIGAGWPGQE